MSSAGTYAIGLDVGGTKIAGGIVDLHNGRVLARRHVATRPTRGGAAVLDDLLGLRATLIDDAGQLGVQVIGTGVGLCELVDPAGQVTSDQTIAWKGVPVLERLLVDGPTVLDADVRAHALAEARYGAGQQHRLFVFVTVGTGISSCLVQDGRPLAGARGNALVLASSPFTFECPVCKTIQRPILEEYASGPALAARYQQAAGMPCAAGETVLAAAQAGDRLAIEIIASAGAALGVSIGWLVNVLDPDAVIVGGGLGSAGGLYWQHMIASARTHIWADTSRELPIVMAALGPDAGLIGAAAAVDYVR